MSRGLTAIRGVHVVTSVPEYLKKYDGVTLNLRDFNWKQISTDPFVWWNARRRAVIQIMRALPKVTFVTGWDECTDEVLKAFIVTTCGQIPTPALRPTQPPPVKVPPIEAPPVIEVQQEQPSRGHGGSGKDVDKGVAIAAASGGIAALLIRLKFWNWFKKKKG